MKYIKVDEMAQGSQITALLYLVLHSATEDLRRTQLPKLKEVESLNQLNSNLSDPDDILGTKDLTPEENLALLIDRMQQLYPDEINIINELKLIQKGEKEKLSVKNHKRLKALADSRGE